jgi:hypothetical protein
MIDRHQASSALADVTDITRRVRQSMFYRHASSMLMLWGALTAVGYTVAFAVPSIAGTSWIVVGVFGIVASIAIGIANRRHAGVNTFDARTTAAYLLFVAFGVIWSVGTGTFTPRQIGAFWASYFMLAYTLAGLWLGRAFVAIGLGVTALTLVGYFFAGPWFNLWMAAVYGGGLLLGGYWMRHN